MAPSHYTQERKGFWHEADGKPTSESIALEAWARTARDVLARTAGTYHAVIREEELAEELMASTGIRTTRPPDRWLPKVLTPLSALCERRGDPPLTALVVSDHDDLEAARRRLECYQWAGSAPADGGVPRQLPGTAPQRRSSTRTRSTRESSERTPKRRVARNDRPVAVCPSCFVALPATGICDYCD